VHEERDALLGQLERLQNRFASLQQQNDQLQSDAVAPSAVVSHGEASAFANQEKDLLKKEYEAELEFLRKKVDGTATESDVDKLLKTLKETQKQKLAIQEKK